MVAKTTRPMKNIKPSPRMPERISSVIPRQYNAAKKTVARMGYEDRVKVTARVAEIRITKRILRKIFLVVLNTGMNVIIVKTMTPNRAGTIYRSLQFRYARLAMGRDAERGIVFLSFI